MGLGDEQIEHAKNAEVDVIDGGLNKLRNILQGFLDRANGATLELFGKPIVRLRIPPRPNVLDKAFDSAAKQIPLPDSLDNPATPLPPIPSSAEKIWSDAVISSHAS